MLETSLHFALGVYGSAGRSWRKPLNIDIKIDDHCFRADWPNSAYPCGDLGVSRGTVPQVDVHRRNGITPIPDLTGGVDEFGIRPMACP